MMSRHCPLEEKGKESCRTIGGDWRLAALTRHDGAVIVAAPDHGVLGDGCHEAAAGGEHLAPDVAHAHAGSSLRYVLLSRGSCCF
jgi:hypothetical protein